MIKKIIYSLIVFIKISFLLKNPFVLFGYLLGKPVRLDFKNGIFLITLQLLDPIIIYETIIDDSYKINALKQPQVIIDVGAGLGDFSILCAKKFTDAKIIAFEPNPEQYKLLRENIKINKVRNVQTYNLAVGTKSSYDLYLAPSSVHSSTIELPKTKKITTVQGTRLDKYINSKVDFLKIDCEGAEIDILKSISPQKMKLIKKIAAEYHNYIINNEDKKIMEILKRHEFIVKKKKNNLIPATGYVLADFV